MNAVDPEQMQMFREQREWLYAEADKLMTPLVSNHPETQEKAWRQLMELSQREEQVNRELERFLNKQKEKS